MKDSIEQQKIMKVFELIKCLHQKERTIEKPIELLDSTQRTVYRYISLLKTVGFTVIKKRKSLGEIIITYRILDAISFLEKTIATQ